MISIFFPSAGLGTRSSGNSAALNPTGTPGRGVAPSALSQGLADGFTPSEEMLEAELGYQLGYLVGKLARQAQLAQLYGSQPQNRVNGATRAAAPNHRQGQAGKVIELKEGDTPLWPACSSSPFFPFWEPARLSGLHSTHCMSLHIFCEGIVEHAHKRGPKTAAGLCTILLPWGARI